MEIKLLAAGLWSVFIPGLILPALAEPATDGIYCHVILSAPTSYGSIQTTSAEVTVKIPDLAHVPEDPTVRNRAVGGSMGVPDYEGTLRDETEKETVIYQGRFTQVVGRELFLPRGVPVVLRPETCFPAGQGEGSLEIYTGGDPQGLRALWMRPPLHGNLPAMKDRYFAVKVQLYDFAYRPVSCHFTGTRTVKPKSFWSGSSTESLTNAEITLVNAPVQKVSIYPAIAPMSL